MKFILALLISALFWSSCQVNTSSINASDNIQADLKAEMRALDAKFLEVIASEDMTAIKEFLSDSLIAISDPKDLEDYMMGLAASVKQSKYSYFEQFDVNNLNPQASTTLMLPSEHAKVNIVAMNTHSFVSMLISDKDFEGDKPMLLFVYGEYPEGWKVNIIHGNMYSFAGQNANYFFAKAKEAYEQGHLIPAALYIDKCDYLKRPVSGWKYDNESKMEGLSDVIHAAVKEDYSFPLPVELATKPTVLGVQLGVDSIGLTPFIQYDTQLDIYDADALTKENDALHKKIGQIFPGMDQQKRVYYRAFEKGNRKNSYGFFKEK